MARLGDCLLARLLVMMTSVHSPNDLNVAELGKLEILEHEQIRCVKTHISQKQQQQEEQQEEHQPPQLPGSLQLYGRVGYVSALQAVVLGALPGVRGR